MCDLPRRFPASEQLDARSDDRAADRALPQHSDRLSATRYGRILPCPPRLARNARTYRITLANGTTQTFTTSDPGRLLLTGQIADLGIMDITQLRGISRTAPYFHNNSAATLEAVLDHYDAFFRRAARLNPPPNLPPILSSNGLLVDRGFVTPEERPALLAYLRKL